MVKRATRGIPRATLVSQPDATDEMYQAALAHHRHGEFALASSLCRTILACDPSHVDSLVLLGGIVRRDGRGNAALKLLTQALALDPLNATTHDSLALAYQGLGRLEEAVCHSTTAITLGLAGVETLVHERPAFAAALNRLLGAWPRPLQLAELLGSENAGTIVDEPLLLAMLRSKVVCDIEIERYLTAVRSALLEFATAPDPQPVLDREIGFFCALAQQCFINEYVFALSEHDRMLASRLRERLVGQLKAGVDIAPLDIVVVALHFPLHELPHATALLGRAWPAAICRLLTQQINEPREEASDLEAIPVLTEIGHDAASVGVHDQYDAYPYPRWAALAPVRPTTIDDYLRDKPGIIWSGGLGKAATIDILVAGCGTGVHSIATAQRFPQSRVLAVDISRRSLAYARRRTREAGLSNIHHGQADILKLGSLRGSFDVIEAVGVLHHLPDPLAGWRTLLALLRPNGVMLVGVFSATGQRPINLIRVPFAGPDGQPSAHDIRAQRQILIHCGQAVDSVDFFTVSGSRYLCFEVPEQPLTIPEIKDFLGANDLAFLGFETVPEVLQRFERQFPELGALTNLDRWHDFEQNNPRTFAAMYLFWVQKNAAFPR